MAKCENPCSRAIRNARQNPVATQVTTANSVSALSCFHHVGFSVTSWTAARQAPLSTGFCRQECCSGLPCPPPGELPRPGIEPMSLMSPALAGRFFATEPLGKPQESTLRPV